MCGATAQQKQLANAQQQMYNTMTQNYQTAYGEQQGIVNALTSTYMPIMQRGPFQPGYSPALETGLNAAASQNVATQYAGAEQALARQQAAVGGGNTLLPSSIQANQQASLAASAAGTRAQMLNQNLVNNYQMGYQNWQNAANVLGGVATNMVNPNQFGNTATSAGSLASTSANQIAQAQNSIWNAAIGGLTGIGGMALGSYLGGAGSLLSGTQNLGQVYSNWGQGLSQPISTVPVGTTGGLIQNVPNPTYG